VRTLRSVEFAATTSLAFGVESVIGTPKLFLQTAYALGSSRCDSLSDSKYLSELEVGSEAKQAAVPKIIRPIKPAMDRARFTLLALCGRRSKLTNKLLLLGIEDC
jgi:hypothetical protein